MDANIQVESKNMSEELIIRPYQHKAIEFLLSRPYDLPHAILADGQGTGKTIAAIRAAMEANCKNGIILGPAIVKEQWRRQMIKWGLAQEDEIQVLYGRDAKLNSAPWKIINYDLVREDAIRKQFLARKWHVLIEDEAHRLKTHTSQQTKAVFGKAGGIANVCYWKWAMSGSIMPNRPAELYPILKTHFEPMLGKQNSWAEFLAYFCGGHTQGATRIPELTERLQKVMLRRELQDVWRECPPIIQNEVWLDVPFEQHPEWVGADFINDAMERRIVAESKIPYVVSYLKERFEDGAPKLVVFTYHRAVTEGIAKQLAKHKPLKIYGGISPKLREANIQSFIENPDHQLLILQIMSAGEGVDGLQHVCAEYVLSEPEWCPGREDQAGRRILRIGQTKTVIETKLIAARSFEETIHYANLRKRKVIEVVTKPNGGIFVGQHFEQSLETLARVASKLEPLIDLLGPALMQAASQQAALITPAGNLPVAPPALVAPAAAVPAPIAVVPASAPTPPPVSAPPAPIAPPAAAAFVAPALVTPAAPVTAPASASSFAGFADRSAFQNHLQELTAPLGIPGGPQLVMTLCKDTFKVDRLANLPEEHVANFLEHVKYNVAQATQAA